MTVASATPGASRVPVADGAGHIAWAWFDLTVQPATILTSGAAVTTNTPLLTLSQIRNNAAVAFDALDITLTDTAAAVNSGAIRVKVGGVQVFLVDDLGNVTALAALAAASAVLTGPLDCSGLKVLEGANAKQGVATLVAGTVTVPNTSVGATSRIHLTAQDNNTVGALRVSARINGTSFTITSSNGADTGVVAWEIFEVG